MTPFINTMIAKHNGVISRKATETYKCSVRVSFLVGWMQRNFTDEI